MKTTGSITLICQVNVCVTSVEPLLVAFGIALYTDRQTHFPFGEYPNVTSRVVHPQTNNKAEVSAVRAVMQTMHSEKDMQIYSASQRCMDMLENIELHKRRKWLSKSKQRMRHSGVGEDTLAMTRVTAKASRVVRVYKLNLVPCIDEAYRLAKVQGKLSVVYKL